MTAPRFPNLAKEFPDFDQATLPADMPEGFTDSAWGNDSCPSWINEEAGLILFVDFADPAAREYPDSSRFSVGVWDNGATGESLIASDDWATVRAFLDSYVPRAKAAPSGFYLAINGRPLCAHTACVAGMRQAEEARVTVCSYVHRDMAATAAANWRTAHPGHEVEVIAGECPEAAEPTAQPDAATVMAGLSEAMGGPLATDSEIERTRDHLACQSSHWNDGNDVCADCGADLAAGEPEAYEVRALMADGARWLTLDGLSLDAAREVQASFFRRLKVCAAVDIICTAGPDKGTTFHTPRGEGFGPEFAMPRNRA